MILEQFCQRVGGLFRPSFHPHMQMWRLFGSCVYTYYIQHGVFLFFASVLAGGCEGGTATEAAPGEVKHPGCRTCSDPQLAVGSLCLSHSIRSPSPGVMAVTVDDNRQSPWAVFHGCPVGFASMA